MQELYHHGIKGMRWGVRRFQNKDGSLTNAGKKRYMDDPTVVESKKGLDIAKSAYRKSSKAYNEAYNNLNINYTRSNKKKYDRAKADRQDAMSKLKDAKFTYNTNKEAARIKEKGTTFEKKSKHRLKLEESYQKMGLSKEQAEAAANNRIRTEKILAASAALTVAACAAYYANSKRKDKIDGIVKAGEALQRIEMRDTNGKLHSEFYAAKGKHDIKRYYNLLGATRQQQAGQAYVMKMQANKDIKVASKKNAAKVFGDLYERDADFRKQVEDLASKHFNGSNRVKNTKDFSSKNIEKMYENFNANIMDLRGTGADQKFYNKLKSMGYGAIQDINDMKYSGYNAKNPLIFIDNSAVDVNSSTKIKENLMAKGVGELMKAQYEVKAKNFLKTAGVASAAGLTGATVYIYKSDPYEEQKRRKDRR